MIIVHEQNHFINRESELSSLQEAFRSDRAELIVIYGRRRIGKTELIKKAIRGKKAGYFGSLVSSVTVNPSSIRLTVYSAA